MWCYHIITADGDCSHEIKRHLFLGSKVMTNLDSVLKKQRFHLANKGPYSQSYGFFSSHVQMWELDMKAKCWRIDAFLLWCWRRFLRVPWTGGRSNQSIIKEIKPWIFIGRTDAEAPILWTPDAKTWLTGKDPRCWERLKAWGEGDDRGWDG